MNLLSRHPCILANQMSIASLRQLRCLEPIRGDDRGHQTAFAWIYFAGDVAPRKKRSRAENKQKAEFLQLQKLHVTDVCRV